MHHILQKCAAAIAGMSTLVACGGAGTPTETAAPLSINDINAFNAAYTKIDPDAPTLSVADLPPQGVVAYAGFITFAEIQFDPDGSNTGYIGKLAMSVDLQTAANTTGQVTEINYVESDTEVLLVGTTLTPVPGELALSNGQMRRDDPTQVAILTADLRGTLALPTVATGLSGVQNATFDGQIATQFLQDAVVGSVGGAMSGANVDQPVLGYFLAEK